MREHSLADIWRASPAFLEFRGTIEQTRHSDATNGGKRFRLMQVMQLLASSGSTAMPRLCRFGGQDVAQTSANDRRRTLAEQVGLRANSIS